MHRLLCVAALLVACSSDDDAPVLTLDWTIHSDVRGDITCDQAMATHVDWTIVSNDGTMISKSYDCSTPPHTVTVTPGTYSQVEGILRSASTSILATCNPSHDNPISTAAHNVDTCEFDVP